MEQRLAISVDPLKNINAKEWDDFVSTTTEWTFFCTTKWWNTYRDVYFLTIRDTAHELVAALPFRLLSMMPIAERFFRTCWLDSSVLVSASLLEDEQVELKKAAFSSLLAHARSMHVMSIVISSKSRSHDGSLFKEIFNYSEKCATFIVDLERDESDIFKSFASGRRNVIRKAQKLGVEVKIEEGDKAFMLIADFCQLQNQLFANKSKSYSNVYFKSSAYLKSLLESNGTFIAIAYHNGVPVAGSVHVATHHDVFYYLGASDVMLNRKTNASSLLKYECIKYAKTRGYRVYDLGGIPVNKPDKSDSLYGVYMYKKEFGGEYKTFDCSSFVIRKYRYMLVWRLRKFENYTLAKWIYKLLKK